VPTWGEILEEIQQSAQERAGNPDLDAIRRKYLKQLRDFTGRDLIVYYTDWFSSGGPAVSITIEDMQGMMEVCKGLAGPELDLILHSPGGSGEDTASIVRYLRQKFSHIRVFVPLAAMSAATMWALACDEIVMGKHSQLGPIDPQMVTPQGQFPARAVIKQFEKAKEECAADPSLLGAWVPILQQYGPALLEQCDRAEVLARQLVQEWLENYMFAGRDNPSQLAEDAAKWFSEYGADQSHRLGISRDQARGHGINIADLETDQQLQDAVLSVHHATMHTLGASSSVKIVENHIGKAYVRQQQVLQMPMPIPMQPAPQPPAPGPVNP
jgi:hypothetical protein